MSKLEGRLYYILRAFPVTVDNGKQVVDPLNSSLCSCMSRPTASRFGNRTSLYPRKATRSCFRLSHSTRIRSTGLRCPFVVARVAHMEHFYHVLLCFCMPTD